MTSLRCNSFERRRYERTASGGSIRGAHLDATGRCVRDQFRVVDLSSGGAGVIAPRGFPCGQRLLLCLEGNRWMQAEVVRCRRRSAGDVHVGVAFCGCDETSPHDAVNEPITAA